jgi:sulfonate transport system substrate-binding protein
MIIRCGGVPEHFNYPWQVAMDKGYFVEEGLDVLWTDYKGGTGAMCQDLRENKLDIATLLTEGAITDIAKGNPSLIHSIYVDSPLIWGIHTGYHSTHINPDAGGKIRYAVSRMGSGSHLMAIVDRIQRNLSIKDTEWIVVQNLEGARKSLIKDESDYFLWEKNMTAPYVYNKELRRIGECPTPWPSVVLTVNKQLMNSTEDLSGLIRALQKAVTYIQNLPDPAQIIAKTYELKEEDARDWYNHIKWSCGEKLSQSVYATTAKILCEAGILTNAPDYLHVCAK